MSSQRRVIMDSDDITLALRRIALQILEKNHEVDKMAIVGIHTCGVYLANRLVSLVKEFSGADADCGNLDITLYRDDWSLIAQSPVVKTTSIDFSIEGKNIILVDDVLYTGRTIRAAMDAIVDYGRPHTIQLAVLVDRGERELPIQPDFSGMVTSIRQNERIQVRMKEKDDSDEVVIES